MHFVTITKTLTTTIPFVGDTPAKSIENAAKEYHDNASTALCNDEDWKKVEVTFSVTV